MKTPQWLHPTIIPNTNQFEQWVKINPDNRDRLVVLKVFKEQIISSLVEIRNFRLKVGLSYRAGGKLYDVEDYQFESLETLDHYMKLLEDHAKMKPNYQRLEREMFKLMAAAN